MHVILLALLTSMSFANDPTVRQVDTGLYAAPQVGVAYLTSETEGGWYVEALDTSGKLLLEKSVVGVDISEGDAVRVAIATKQQDSGTMQVALASGHQVQVTINKRLVSVTFAD